MTCLDCNGFGRAGVGANSSTDVSFRKYENRGKNSLALLRALHSVITTSTPLFSSGIVERVKYASTRENRHPQGRSHAKGSEHLPPRVTFLTVAIST